MFRVSLPVVYSLQSPSPSNLLTHFPQAREILETDPEYAGLDLSPLTPDWTSKAGFYSASEDALRARARWVRRWLRARPEREIVVVAHGDILRYVIEGFNSHSPWANAEVRAYTFELEEAEDKRGEAWMVPVSARAGVAKKGGEEPTSSEVAQEKVGVAEVDSHRPLYN